MPLTNEQVRELWAEWMDTISAHHEQLQAVTKGDLRDGVNSTSLYLDTLQASFNDSLPQILRDNLTAHQKRWMFWVVAKKHWEVY